MQICMMSVGAILFLDGLFLILQKKIHLGTLLPFLIGLGLCLYAFYLKKISVVLNKTHPKNNILKKFINLAWILFLIWALSVAGFFLYLKSNINQSENTADLKAIIVLGSGLIQGKPSPTLAARLDRSADVARRHPDALIVVTGGLGTWENQTEAEAMAKYLEQQHSIPIQRIATEDQSTSTELNLKNTKAILKVYAITLDMPISIVTSDFHTLRASAIAKKQGYSDIYTVSAETPLMTRYNAWLREYFAYLSGWLLKEY
ncbi:MAG: YdcF family protein [Candidatus Acinetobacter avistercoris]|uniref:YdcF family protein n=1 Tax=Acinetobacter sp. KS-LM10 TaxID=3120518 RepID=UPI001F9791ED|nr:YdcF family protein [Candidatus Acinetobacter avistercoris]